MAKVFKFRRYELTGYRDEIVTGDEEEIVFVDPNGSHFGEFAPDHRPIIIITAEVQ